MKDSMEERRLLLAIALSLLVVTGYQLFFAPRPVPRPSASPVPAPAPPPGSAVAPAEPAASASPVPALVEAARADSAERRVEATTRDLTVAFSNRGARLVSFKLNGYSDARGRPEEMVPASVGGVRPLDIETGDTALDERLRGALFVASRETLVGAGELVFEYASGELSCRRVFRFQSEGFLLGVEASVRRGGANVPLRLAWGPGLANPTARETEVQGYVPPQAVARSARGVERVPPKDLTAPRTQAEAAWAGVENHYFAALLLPAAPGPAELRGVELAPGDDGKARRAALAAVALPAGQPTARVYVGPKDWDALHALRLGLEDVVPVGDWLGPIVVPLLRLLRLVHSRVGNYGWSIVALTVLINLVMGPLRHMSIANGMKMAKLSPEMRAIQARYKGIRPLDPQYQSMQKEIGALYARHGMSMGTQMLVGCLPMLLTLPFLFAFYRVLNVAVELRGASFLWIPDLSHRDPLFLTPLLLGVSMFVMQRLTPSTLDPAQQRIMMMMPLMLVAMFFAAPAGLNLYWLASNLCSIVQQGVTLRLLKAKEAHPREERRRA
jgi:YidC/Oxa1 family membrane protein insertase